MPVHDNSIAAFEDMDRDTRQTIVFDCYRSYPKGLTDREVMKLLGFIDMNTVRPRVTEMVNGERPRLEEIGKRRDDVTGRSVRVVSILVPSKQGEFCYE